MKTSRWHERVKSLGLPIRVALVQGIVSCRMYSSLRQLERGWSRILYAALDQKPWRLVAKLLDPIVFCQTGHVALLVSMVLLFLGRGGAFAVYLLVLSIIHHLLMYVVFRRIYSVSVPRSRIRRVVSRRQSRHRRNPAARHRHVRDGKSLMAGHPTTARPVARTRRRKQPLQRTNAYKQMQQKSTNATVSCL